MNFHPSKRYDLVQIFKHTLCLFTFQLMLLYRKVTKDLNNNMENVMIILYEKILTALNTLESDDFYSTTSIDGGHMGGI